MSTARPLRDGSSPQFGLVPRDDHPPSASPIEMAMPGVHLAAKRLLDAAPRGTLVDLGAGAGAMSAWADREGFRTIAVDIDQGSFVPETVEFVKADLNRSLPLKDGTADVVVALEVIEHLENAYALLREVSRLLKPGGYAVVSTPNESNLAARMSYLVSGFFSDAAYVMRVAGPDENYSPHINCLPLPTLEFAWRKAGLSLIRFQASRHRFVSCLLWPLIAPWQWLKLTMRHHKPRHADRATVRGVHRLMNDPRVQTARILVFLLQKPTDNPTRSN